MTQNFADKLVEAIDKKRSPCVVGLDSALEAMPKDALEALEVTLDAPRKVAAGALVKFNMQGQIQSSKIISSSGNNSYDQYCLKAIADSAPFPKVPEKLTEKFSVDGIVIGFPE